MWRVLIYKGWRVADISPVTKNGKDPHKLDNYHKISLISTICNATERLVTNRLLYEAETLHILSENQAGFRNGCSTEDKLLRRSQSIRDGFQCKPMKMTVFTIIDYSRAYDRVWRQAQLQKMLSKDVSSNVIRHIQEWPTNRLRLVTIEGAKSKKTISKQVVPQGSALLPQLFSSSLMICEKDLETIR